MNHKAPLSDLGQSESRKYWYSIITAFLLPLSFSIIELRTIKQISFSKGR